MDENNVYIIKLQNCVLRKRKRKKHQWIEKSMHTKNIVEFKNIPLPSFILTFSHTRKGLMIENGHLSE